MILKKELEAINDWEIRIDYETTIVFKKGTIYDITIDTVYTSLTVGTDTGLYCICYCNIDGGDVLSTFGEESIDIVNIIDDFTNRKCKYTLEKNDAFPRLYCSVNNGICIYAKRCDKRGRFILGDDFRDCHRYQTKRNKI